MLVVLENLAISANRDSQKLAGPADDRGGIPHRGFSLGVDEFFTFLHQPLHRFAGFPGWFDVELAKYPI